MRIRAGVRAVFFWSHLAIGLAAGLLILLMSITGVMLGFERQMIAWIDGAPRVAASEHAALPLDSVLTRAGLPRDTVTSIVVRRNAALPVTVRVREGAPVHLDPFRGEVLVASGAGKGQTFFSALRRWHRWIGAQGQELRAQMKVVAGVANLVFLALVLSGLYLWWPRHWSWKRLRATTLPQWHHAGKARDFNWHNSLGFWAAIPLALVIASAAFISFRWPGQWLDVALGNEREKVAAREALRAADAPLSAPTRARASDAPRQQFDDAALALLVERAVATRPEWAQLTITLPSGNADAVRVAVAEGNTYRPDLRWTLTMHRESAVIQESTGYADLSLARKIRAWVRFGHTGEVFGITGQIIATLASAVGVLLVWTGFALAWRRLVQWRKRRRRLIPAVLTLPDATIQAPATLR